MVRRQLVVRYIYVRSVRTDRRYCGGRKRCRNNYTVVDLGVVRITQVKRELGKAEGQYTIKSGRKEMASRRNGDKGATDASDNVTNILQLVAQQLAHIQETLRLQQQEADRKVQEILQQKEANRKAQEALKQQKVERMVQEAVRVHEQRARKKLQEMERKLREKDDVIRALQQRLRETQERGTAVEEDTTPSEGSGGEGGVQRLEGRVKKVDVSSQRKTQEFLPHVGAPMRHLKEPHFTSASLATAASQTDDAPATGEIAADSEEEPPPPEDFPAPSSSPSSYTPSLSGAGHQGAAADEEERERRLVEHRVRKVEKRMEEARNCPSPLGERLFKAAREGKFTAVRRLVDAGADVNYPDEIGCTPLFKAVLLEAHVDVVWLLLTLGADVNAVNSFGSSALHWASIRRHSGHCVTLLVGAGADVNARDVDGETPLHWAANRHIDEAARALIAAGARRDLKPWSGRWKNKTPFDITRSHQVRGRSVLQRLLDDSLW